MEVFDQKSCGVRLHPLMQQSPVVLVLAELRPRHSVEAFQEVLSYVNAVDRTHALELRRDVLVHDAPRTYVVHGGWSVHAKSRTQLFAFVARLFELAAQRRALIHQERDHPNGEQTWEARKPLGIDLESSTSANTQRPT